MQIPLLIATATEDLAHSHSVWDALPHLGGMLMVLVTLTVMWGITASVAKIIAILHAKQPAPVPAPAAVVPEPAAPPVTSADAVPVAAIAAAVAALYENEQIVPSEVAAVIAAAVACMSGGSRRIISIKPADTSWEKAGRQSILYSHRIR